MVRHFPNSLEANTSKAFLQKIDANFSADARDAAVGVSLPPPAQGNANATAGTAGATAHLASSPSATNTGALPAKSGLSKKQLVAALVQIAPRRSNLPDVGYNFSAEIKETLEKYPLPVLNLLYSNNCKILLMPSVVENDFRMQNAQPGGYWEGANFENVPAYFHAPNIAIGQYASDPSGAGYQPAQGYIGTLRHEVGHAIDCFLGGVSDSPEFRHAWTEDCYTAEARANQKKLAYFLTEGERGQAETFAELCCYDLGGRTDPQRSEQCQMLHNICKNCEALVQGYLKPLQ